MPRVDLFTPLHKALRPMIYELGRELQTTDFTDENATNAIVSKLKNDQSSASSACIICLLHEHAGNEDRYVFPEVKQYEPEMVERLSQEHGEVVRRITAVWKIVDELKTLTNRDERILMGDELNRSANELFAYYLTHLNGEEVTILPATWKHFTDEQLVAMRSSVERNMSTERYAEWMSWVFPLLKISELTGMFMGLRKGAPPPVLENIARMAEKALGEERWRAAKTRAGL